MLGLAGLRLWPGVGTCIVNTFFLVVGAHSGGRIGRFSRQVVPTPDVQVRFTAAQSSKQCPWLGCCSLRNVQE
jgi:hypothetical protein